MGDSDREQWSERWQNALARFQPFAAIYEGSRFAGSDRIVKDYLGIPAELPIPVTFQHGVPTGTSASTFDIEKPEPLFLALTEEGARAAEPLKPVLRFPHPWLMLPPMMNDGASKPRRTLFIALPSGPGNNQRLYDAISSSDLPRPWSILLKWRGLNKDDFDWWRARDFAVHTAGYPSGASFYLNLRSIIASHDRVVLPYATSLAVFAAAMSKRIEIISDVDMHYVTEADLIVPNDGEALVTWNKLLSEDVDIAQQEAFRLLGVPFLADKDVMSARLFDAFQEVDNPVHLAGVPKGVITTVLTTAWKQGVPVPKLLPTPVHTIARKFMHLAGLNRLTLVTGNEFHHFGITQGPGLRLTPCRAYQVGRKIGLGEAPRTELRG